MMKLTLAAVLALATPAGATVVDELGQYPAGWTRLAEQLPLERRGGCPPGWRESGGHCVAGEDTRTQAVPRGTGPCPQGWITSGAYCTRPSPDRR
jgi:hypothetical protein